MNIGIEICLKYRNKFMIQYNFIKMRKVKLHIFNNEYIINHGHEKIDICLPFISFFMNKVETQILVCLN